MVNFGPLTAKIVSGVWGTPANFNGFRVLPPLLHGTLVVGVSQTAALNRGRHLYSAGRPLRWALAHILVEFCCIRNKNASGKTRTECVRTDQKILLLAVNVLVPSLMVVRLFFGKKKWPVHMSLRLHALSWFLHKIFLQRDKGACMPICPARTAAKGAGPSSSNNNSRLFVNKFENTDWVTVYFYTVIGFSFVRSSGRDLDRVKMN